MPGSDTPKDAMAGTGESEADAARAVPFEPRPDAGRGEPPAADPAPDAAEVAGTKRQHGEDNDEAPTGATSPADLTTESDDGAG